MKTKALDDVVSERCRQITREGWTHTHDDMYSQGELAVAAGCYALFGEQYPDEGQPPPQWPWEARWWKPASYRRNLVKSAALTLAAIEQADRANDTDNEIMKELNHV